MRPFPQMLSRIPSSVVYECPCFMFCFLYHFVHPQTLWFIQWPMKRVILERVAKAKASTPRQVVPVVQALTRFQVVWGFSPLSIRMRLYASVCVRQENRRTGMTQVTLTILSLPHYSLINVSLPLRLEGATTNVTCSLPHHTTHHTTLKP